MTESKDDVMARLRALGEAAAPASPRGPHLTSAELERVRSFDEDEALDGPYRHLSTCSACRARLTEVAASVVPPRASNFRARWRVPAFAAAALVVLGVGYGLFRNGPADAELVVSQRSYSGTMGAAAPPAPPTENGNLELSFPGAQELHAFLLPCSAQGEALSPPHWFAREGERSVVVVAPRTFRAHSGKVLGFVVWGDRSAVESVAAKVLSELAHSPSLPATEGKLSALAQSRGAHLKKLVLETH